MLCDLNICLYDVYKFTSSAFFLIERHEGMKGYFRCFFELTLGLGENMEYSSEKQYSFYQDMFKNLFIDFE